LTLQVTVASGSPVQKGKVTAATKVPALVGVTVKVEVVDPPASTAAGVVGVENLNVGAAMF